MHLPRLHSPLLTVWLLLGARLSRLAPLMKKAPERTRWHSETSARARASDLFQLRGCKSLQEGTLLRQPITLLYLSQCPPCATIARLGFQQVRIKLKDFYSLQSTRKFLYYLCFIALFARVNCVFYYIEEAPSGPPGPRKKQINRSANCSCKSSKEIISRWDKKAYFISEKYFGLSLFPCWSILGIAKH